MRQGIGGIVAVLGLALALPQVAWAKARDEIVELTGHKLKELLADVHQVEVSEETTIVAPIRVKDAEGREVVMQPTHCHSLYGNALGTYHVCDGRTFVETNPTGYGGRLRGGYWKATDGATLVPLTFGWSGDTEDLDILLRSDERTFSLFGGWTPAHAASLVQGHVDIAAQLAEYGVARGALSAPPDAPSRVPDPGPATRDPGKAIVWADASNLQEFRIKQIDGKTAWRTFLNGFAVFAEVEPGHHDLLVFLLGPFVEKPLPVDLQAGHTYVVAFDYMDRVVIEDLGTDATCVRRKYDIPGFDYLRLVCTRG